MYELRANGIVTCHGGQIFQNLRNLRNSKVNNKQSSNRDWKYLIVNNNDTLTGTEQIIKHCMDLNHLPRKRRSTPLNIIGLSFYTLEIILLGLQIFYCFPGLPNYEKLSKDEQELCSSIRVIPNAFLSYKKLLIMENTKIGYLRLADARKLIKIDVNKTRLLYDFLFDHGFLNKPSK